MKGHLEVWSEAGFRVVPLAGEAMTIGRQGDVGIRLEDDLISRVHAVLEPLGSGWSIRDLGSRNGTTVNSERVVASRALHSGDEVRIGSCRLVYRVDTAPSEAPLQTRMGQEPPGLTRREKDMLVVLCKPLNSSKPFASPATVSEIAKTLYVTEGAVRQHLLNLYDKFGIDEEGDRRQRLASEAILRGAVTIADLRSP